MSNLLYIILGLIAIIVAIVAIPFIILWLVAVFVLMLVVAFIGHLFGVPIQVKEDGKVIGEIKRFKFYPNNR